MTSYFKFIRNFIVSLIKNNVNQYYFFILCIAFVFYFLFYRTSFEDEWFTKHLDPWATIITASLALVLWANDSYSIWKNNLPKKLTCHFKLLEHYVMTCHKADLAHEGDIRNFSTQIAFQMSDSTINYYPYFEVHSKIENIDNQHVLHYKATFFLNKDEPFKKPTEKTHKLDHHYLVWWENSAHTSANKALLFDHRPTQPISDTEAQLEFDKKCKELADIETQ